MQARTQFVFEKISSGLNDVIQKVVFVGGSALSLYITDDAAPEFHPSNDVDLIIDVDSKGEYLLFEQQLLDRNFRKIPVSSGPDTWEYDGITICTTPVYAELSGFFNRWYEEGVFHARNYSLPDGTTIRIFDPAYFVASKLDAFHNRGSDDPRKSEDFQDLIYLLDNRSEIIDDVTRAFYNVRAYIREEFTRIMSRNDFEEGIVYALPGNMGEDSIEKIREIMGEVVSFGPDLVKA